MAWINPLAAWSWKRVCHLWRMDLRSYLVFFGSLSILMITLLLADQSMLFKAAKLQQARLGWTKSFDWMIFVLSRIAYGYAVYMGIIIVNRAQGTRMLESIYLSKVSMFQWASSILLQVEFKIIWGCALIVPTVCYFCSIDLISIEESVYLFAWILTLAGFWFSAAFFWSCNWRKLAWPITILLAIGFIGYVGFEPYWKKNIDQAFNLLHLFDLYPNLAIPVLWIVTLSLMSLSSSLLPNQIKTEQTLRLKDSQVKLKPIGTDLPFDWIQKRLLRNESTFRTWSRFLLILAGIFFVITLAAAVVLLTNRPILSNSTNTMNGPFVLAAEQFFGRFTLFCLSYLICLLYGISSILSVREDRVRKTWDSLLVLPISHSDLVLAKTKAVLGRLVFLWGIIGVYLILRWLTNHGDAVVFVIDLFSVIVKSSVIALLTIYLAAQHEKLTYWLPLHMIIGLVMISIFSLVISLSLSWISSDMILIDNESELSKVVLLDQAIYLVIGILVFAASIANCDLALERNEA